MSRRFFVTGTDTGVGKTQVAVALLSVMAERGWQPFAWKPCETGGGGDAAALWRAAGMWQRQESVCSYRFAAPLAPGVAARLEGRRVDMRKLLREYQAFGPGAGVVEGAGGLLVPLTERVEVVDFVARLGLPVVLVARAGLGTLNHTSLSLEALHHRHVKVAAVILNQTARRADASVEHNIEALQRRWKKVVFVGPVPYLRQASRRAPEMKCAVRAVLEKHRETT